jgi:alanine dehydrogenase
MRIGVPKETKDQENRVAATPDGIRTLAAAGHELVVERGAGAGSGFSDAQYAAAGARLAATAEAWRCELVLKVKEPTPAEYRYLTGQILFSYLHLAAAPLELTERLLASRTTALACETIQDASGRYPLLTPMSAIAGGMAPLVGAYYLAKTLGGRGTLLASLLGARNGQVVIVGDGVVGMHACTVASGLGANVTVFGIIPERAVEIEKLGRGVRYARSTPESLAAALPETDLLIGAVLLPGARAPHVVTEPMVRSMPAGAVIVDVSIDQGGCVATSRPTSHSKPVFVTHGVTHYCVSNMPGAYPRTSTSALTAATLPYVLELAAGGTRALASPTFAGGLSTFAGFLTHAAAAESLGMLARYRAPAELLR